MLVSIALALLATASALDTSLNFHYAKHPVVFRRNGVSCQVCYGQFDCLGMDRCGYNAAVSEILEEDQLETKNDGLKTKVDSMMYDLVLEDSLKEYNECIPLISTYTTCNKDNICLGCKSCECNESGRWNCSETSKCSRFRLNVDHGVLASVIASLVDQPSRYKRFLEDSEEPTHTYEYEDFLKLLISKLHPVPFTSRTVLKPSANVTTEASIKNQTSEDNNVLFDDILSNDELENFVKSEPGDDKITEIYPYKFIKVLQNIEEGKDDIQTDNPDINTNVIKSLKQYIEKKTEDTENGQPNSIKTLLTDTEDIELNKQLTDSNSVSLVLTRNVRDVNETAQRNQSKIINVTHEEPRQVINATNLVNKTKIITHTHSEKELQHIIDVITVLIGNEKKEIRHLTYVRDIVMNLIKKQQKNSNNTDINKSNADKYYSKHGNWKVDMLHFYMNNLKRDVKDTLRDIYTIQKLKRLGINSVSDNISSLKPLLFALTSYYMKNYRDYQHIEYMKQYLNETSSMPSIINNTPDENDATINQVWTLEPKIERRAFLPTNTNIYPPKLIKRALRRMLQVIDKEMLSTSALSPLSAKTKTILNRIIDKEYAKTFSNIHPSIRDPNFNLTKIITSVAELWQNEPAQMNNVETPDQLYNEKLLHLTLSQGIDKLKDALISVQFGYSRRMTFIEEYVGKALIADIARQLAVLNDQIMKHVVMNEILSDVITPKTHHVMIHKTKDDQAESVWNHIKSTLTKSKNNMLQYFHDKFKPKSYIVNEDVRKRAEAINKLKFLEVMKRWQTNFDSHRARNKRSVQQYGKRMKNIIPKYLRGIKLNPTLKDNQEILIKAPVIEASRSKGAFVNRRHTLKTTPTVFTKPAQRIPDDKALHNHLKVGTSSVLARKGQNLTQGPVNQASGLLKGRELSKEVPVTETALFLKGQPKRGVRTQNKH